MTSVVTHKMRWDKYRDDTVVQKCLRFALWTLPQLMADLDQSNRGTSMQLERDYQEIGAMLTNNLAAKLAAILIPANVPFIKVEPSAALIKRAEENGTSAAELDSALAKMEMDASKRIFLNASYNQIVQALKYLIVTGNVLIHRDSEVKQTSAYGPNQFSIRRDGRGRMLDCVLREAVAFDGLDPEVRTALRAKNPARISAGSFDISLELYTRINCGYLKGNKVYIVSQEIEGMPVGTPSVYPEHLCPYMAPTWNLLAGEHYGRGLVEDMAGGFAKLSDSSEALALYGISAMKFINLVAPGQGANLDEIQAAETGEYVQGQKDSINIYEAGDGNKIAAMAAIIDATFQNLARAFMYTGQARNSERTTAYELRLQAGEANTVLGGQYSSLAESLQVPLGHLLLTEVHPGMLEGIISGDIKLDIIAGSAALGRAAGAQSLLAVAQTANAVAGVLLQVDPRISRSKLMDFLYASESVDSSVFLMDKKEQAEYDAAKQQEAQGQQQLTQASDVAAQAQAIQSLS